MKLRWIFLLAVSLTLATIAVSAGVALLAPDSEPWMFVVTAVSAMLLITAPAIASLVVAHITFDLDSSDGKRVLRRLVLVFAGIQLLGVVGLALVGFAAPETIAFVAAVVTVAAVLMFVGIRLGLRLQPRFAIESAEHEAWSRWSPTVIRSKARRVVVVFTIASAVGIGALVALELATGDDGADSLPLGWAIYGFGIGFISASVACLVVAWPLIKDLRRALGRDYATQKAIGRVVLRNKADQLSDDGQRRAATYAAIMAAYLPFQTAQLVLLFAGLWLQQVWSLTNGSSSGGSAFAMGLVIAYPVIIAALLPFIIRQARRVKRYADLHADLVTTSVADP